MSERKSTLFSFTQKRTNKTIQQQQQKESKILSQQSDLLVSIPFSVTPKNRVYCLRPQLNFIFTAMSSIQADDNTFRHISGWDLQNK